MGFEQLTDVAFVPELRVNAKTHHKLVGKKVQRKMMFENPLAWWKANQGLYPILARLAKIYLAIPASSAPSERVFSVASRLISSKRTSMGTNIAGKTLYVSENWDMWKDKIDYLAVIQNTNELDESENEMD